MSNFNHITTAHLLIGTGGHDKKKMVDKKLSAAGKKHRRTINNKCQYLSIKMRRVSYLLIVLIRVSGAQRILSAIPSPLGLGVVELERAV